jgi:hypothetical protein
MNERMKTKNHDQLDAHNSIFAAARCSDDHSVSKTTPFADISFQGAGILTRVRGYRSRRARAPSRQVAQPPATFWQPSGLAIPKRQFLIVCQRHNPKKTWDYSADIQMG